MINYQTEFLSQYISNLRISRNLSRLAYQAGNALYLNNQCVLQSREGEHFAYTVEDDYQDFQTDVFFDTADKKVELQCNCNAEGFCSHKVSALMQLHEDLSQEQVDDLKTGMKYTREGMINRVIAEREMKAQTEKYQLDFADNIYGEHLITNPQNRTYKLTFYDYEKEQGYCSCPDHHTNKLGTCKHLIYAFGEFRKFYQDKAIPSQEFPFLEVFLHPLKEYRIAWFYPGKLSSEITALISNYFDATQTVSQKKILEFNGFVRKAQNHKFIKIRPEVVAKIQKTKERQSLSELKSSTKLDFDALKINLYPYQKEGVEFIVFNKGVILADEVGLGKTIQAIVAAQIKKELFNLQSVLIVCPGSLIQHWEHEIQMAGNESSIVIKEEADFLESESYFKIIGFDDFARHSYVFDTYSPDMFIIDEAQKISNFDSDLVRIIRRVKHRHLLIITDAKPENHPMQFYTMVGLIDNTALTPLWEFSYQHCLFDSQVQDKIIGYYNQENIPRRIPTILLRREKEEVSKQLQKINRMIVPVNLRDNQQVQHQKLANETLFLLNKKLKTKFDWQKMAQLFLQMKNMASLVFISKPNVGLSAKFEEFKHFLLEKTNFRSVTKKMIVFAEKEESRKHLIRFFKEQRVSVELVNSGQNVEQANVLFNRFLQSQTSSVLILQEGLHEKLPEADVLIYYDLSLDQIAVEKRFVKLQQHYTAQPPLLVHFLCLDSIENVLYQIQQEKQSSFEEIVAFLMQKEDDAELSREVQSKLKTKLQILLNEKKPLLMRDSTGQTLLFPLNEEKSPLSLSGEEHKAFESQQIEKIATNPIMPKTIETKKIEKLLLDAQAFLAGLYSIQTGEELPWKAEDIDLKINEEEIILRIKRK